MPLKKDSKQRTARTNGRKEFSVDKELFKGSDLSYDGDMYAVKTPTGEIYKISPERFNKMSAEYNRREKNKKTASWLCVLFGFLGVHRYYVGDYLKGLLLFGTCGGMLFGWLLDYFFIKARIDEINRDLVIDLLIQAIEATRKDKEAEECKLKKVSA